MSHPLPHRLVRKSRHCKSERSYSSPIGTVTLRGLHQDQYVVACREALMFAVSEIRKNRQSHRSQRSGLTKTMASILSRIPLRLDWWIRSLWQRGQCFMCCSWHGQSGIDGQSLNSSLQSETRQAHETSNQKSPACWLWDTRHSPRARRSQII